MKMSLLRTKEVASEAILACKDCMMKLIICLMEIGHISN
jgi:hypothetical protein